MLERFFRSHFLRPLLLCLFCRILSGVLCPFSPALYAGYCVRSFQANCIRRSFLARGIDGLAPRRPFSAPGRIRPSRPVFFSRIRPILADRKTPPRPLGLNAGVAHAACFGLFTFGDNSIWLFSGDCILQQAATFLPPLVFVY